MKKLFLLLLVGVPAAMFAEVRSDAMEATEVALMKKKPVVHGGEEELFSFGDFMNDISQTP